MVIAYGNNAFRDISCDDASGADDGILADGDPGHDHYSCPYPDVFTDVDILVVLKIFTAELRIDWMAGGSDRDVWSDHDAISYIDVAVIDHR